MMYKNCVKFRMLSALTVACLSMAGLVNSQTKTSNVLLTIKTGKERYILGELVNFDSQFFNSGQQKIAIIKNAADAGAMRLLIKRKTDTYYRQYNLGGKKRGNFVLLDGNETANFICSALFNGKPDYSHLNPDAARRADSQDNKILTDLVFPETGVYNVKAVSYYQTLDNYRDLQKPSIEIESEPIEITITEPKGEDLEVWNQIKGNRDIAVLMQSNHLFTSDLDEKAKLVNQVEQIIERYPNSTYSAYLKPSLEKFKAHDAKLEEFKAKIKAQAKP
jgi:hypothetical protein